MKANEVSFKDASGRNQEVALDVHDYMEAGEQKLSLSQHYARKYPTAADSKLSTFEQFVHSAGIRLRSDPARGITASSVKEIYHGNLDKSMGTIVRGTGADRQTTVGRHLFPEIMMSMVAQELTVNKEDYLAPWEAAIAMKTSISGPRADEPRISITAPESSAAQSIAQLAEPAVMISISLSGKSYEIPTKSIGIEIADQAMEAMTIDRLGITLAAQARGERIRRLEADMVNIISGDTDYGIAATGFVNASTFDSTIPGTNKITHRAYVKWLRHNYQKMTITHILADEDTALDLGERVGRPTMLTAPSGDITRFPVDYSIENLGLPSPRLLLLPTSIVGANRLVGFDARNALHEITNTSASYSATENFVLRRSTAMRFDFGILLVKMQDEAFTGMTIGA